MSIYQGENKVSGLSVNESVPVGTVVSFASNNIPNGWWICDGREVSRTDYKQLFDAIGTTWGDGNGSTTFNIPNTKDLFIQGANGNVGETIDAGLPNITGDKVANTLNGNLAQVGALSTYITTEYGSSGTPTGGCSLKFDASKGETKTDGTLKTDEEHHVYGSSDTVQPPSVCMNYIIKYSNVLMSEVKVIDDSVIAEDKCYSSQKTVDVIDEKVKEVYSTEEKVIGTWFDGKPIYRKVFTGLSQSIETSWTNVNNVSIPDVDEVINGRIYANEESSAGGKQFRAVNIGYLNGSFRTFSSGNVTINKFLVEYTKTTD